LRCKLCGANPNSTKRHSDGVTDFWSHFRNAHSGGLETEGQTNDKYNYIRENCVHKELSSEDVERLMDGDEGAEMLHYGDRRRNGYRADLALRKPKTSS
jgi:hypothetical protein